MEQLTRKEKIQIKINKIKEKNEINSLKNLRFIKFADEEIINNIRPVLKSINCYEAKPEKIIAKTDNREINLENLKNVIEKNQMSGNWIIPSELTEKWYEVKTDDIKAGVQELFELYGEDYFTIVLKETKILIDVFWDESYEGICSKLGIYCIYIKKIY